MKQLRSRDGGMSAGKTSFFPRNFSPGGGGGLLFKLVAVYFARGFSSGHQKRIIVRAKLKYWQEAGFFFLSVGVSSGDDKQRFSRCDAS